MAWLAANWMQIVVAIVGIDAVLIPIFPQVPFLKSLYDFLSKVAPPKA